MSEHTSNPRPIPEGLKTSDVLADYKLACTSRAASIAGRKEVLSGRAKFGIFGDGKEIPQVALAREFRAGDWRAGYYRDQTLVWAVGASDVRKFFAQLYADPDLTHEPASGGRQMNAHFATRFLDLEGRWLAQTLQPNISADISPTAAQMARALGLAYASKYYRNEARHLQAATHFSDHGNEVTFATIGNASAAEGIFWETLNAAGVLQVPLIVSVWDDGYGISVPNPIQMTRNSVSVVLRGFDPGRSPSSEPGPGVRIYEAMGWDYAELIDTYRKATAAARKDHQPALIHVRELTQPQGHSTSGSHERYKSPERLQSELDLDGIQHMRRWMLKLGLATERDLKDIEDDAHKAVEQARVDAWAAFMQPIEGERSEAMAILRETGGPGPSAADSLRLSPTLQRRTIHSATRRTLFALQRSNGEHASKLAEWNAAYSRANEERYNSHLYAESLLQSPLRVRGEPPTYDANPDLVDGRVLIQRAFDDILTRDPRVFVVGEDVGILGGVNLEFEGLHQRHGAGRVTDTGIREATILGQGLGAAMRGLRPVVDIQYLDYLLYALQLLSDDLATLRYRTAGGQAAPVIVRTKGHRLEGIWHTGSPMGTIVHALRGMHVCVPRNMTQAVGMYHTLLQGDDPALVVEVLNGYRVKEPMPSNLNRMTVPLGVPEVLRSGRDLTVVTYGATVRLALEAAQVAAPLGIDCEVIDIQTLLPWDRPQIIAQSLQKTHALLVVDEDVPGGASAYVLQCILDEGGAFDSLDVRPRTLSAKAHRAAYAADGDYYSKPSVEDILEAAASIQNDR